MAPADGQGGMWVLERLSGGRFPFRVRITSADGMELTLRAPDRWPTANRNLFCLREEPVPDEEPAQVLERIPLLALRRSGVRLSVILDRPRYRRCDFLFITRRGRENRSEEQIFWQTQASMTQHRTKIGSGVLNQRSAITVQIASDERYPWTFPGSTVVRGLLPAGDYALLQDGKPAAVVERKTLDNLLGDFGVMAVLQQRLLDLSRFEHNAFVVEAPYEDFLNPRKSHHYAPAYCARVIASLYVQHPRVRIVFCSNRKTANLWTRSFFAAVAALPADEQPDRLEPV